MAAVEVAARRRQPAVTVLAVWRRWPAAAAAVEAAGSAVAAATAAAWQQGEGDGHGGSRVAAMTRRRR